MTDERKRKGGGAKTSRSEVVTVRLEPKLRYLAELAGRKQRRTLSGFIEWAIETGLKEVYLESGPGDHMLSIADRAAQLWDVDEQDRFIKLAIRYPDLLTHDEQVMWKLIRENGFLWRGRYAEPDKEWAWKIREDDLRFERLREHWETFVAVANGEKDRSELPQWKRTGPNAKGGFDDMPDELPSF